MKQLIFSSLALLGKDVLGKRGCSALPSLEGTPPFCLPDS